MTLQRQQHGLYALAAGLLVAAALAAVLCLGLPVDMSSDAYAARTVHDARLSDTSAVKLPDRAAFEPLLSLPLRGPLYDPVAVVEAPKPKVIPPLRIALLGTIIEPDQALAVIRDSAGKTQFLAVGQSLEEASIVAIEPNRVTIAYYDQQQILTTPFTPAATDHSAGGRR